MSDSAVTSDGTGAVQVRVDSVRRLFHNGEHNAFTDLCRFRGRFFLTFRSCPDGHSVSPTASVIVLASDDATTWEQVHRFRVARRDTRDPHFLVFRETLFVYSGTWSCADESATPNWHELNEHLGYAVWTRDGDAWDGPAMLEGTFGHYIWRAATHGGKAYLCGRRKREFAYTTTLADGREIMESAMLESDDGLIWKKAALFQEQHGDETAFLFEPDGALLAVARTGGNAQLCRSRPPYAEWERKDLGRHIGGPLLAQWNGRYVVGGRKPTPEAPRTTLYWLIDDELQEFAELPSAGDNSYPGLVELSPTRALVSYYSSHELDGKGDPITAIYLAQLANSE